VQQVAGLRAGDEQRREPALGGDERLLELGRSGQDRPPSADPLARPVREPGQQPLRPGRRARSARSLEVPEVVEPAHQRGEQPAPPRLIELLEEQPVMAFGDGVGAAERAAHLEHLGHRQVRPGEPHRRLVLAEVLAVPAEPGDQVGSAEPEREGPRPGPAAKLADVTGPAPVPLAQEPGRVREQHRPAGHLAAIRTITRLRQRRPRGNTISRMTSRSRHPPWVIADMS